MTAELTGMNEQAPQPQAKKPYQTPRLVVYGDIRKLTENAARNTNRDGHSNAKSDSHTNSHGYSYADCYTYINTYR